MTIKTLIEDILVTSRCVRHGQLRLPPAALCRCSIEFKDDEFFVESAVAKTRKLVEHRGLTTASGVLDIEASSTPLHRVRLNRGFFETLLSTHGLAMVRFDHACEHDGQSGVYLGAAT